MPSTRLSKGSQQVLRRSLCPVLVWYPRSTSNSYDRPLVSDSLRAASHRSPYHRAPRFASITPIAASHQALFLSRYACRFLSRFSARSLPPTVVFVPIGQAGSIPIEWAARLPHSRCALSSFGSRRCMIVDYCSSALLLSHSLRRY